LENTIPELSVADQISKRPDLPEESILLRIFISEGDRFGHQPLADAILLRARKFGLAGATVLTGPMGFGKSSRMHTQKHLRISSDLPVVIEIVDILAKIETFSPVLDMRGGLVTLERAQVIRYGQKKPDQKRRWF
jgi:PII-like signaling protein